MATTLQGDPFNLQGSIPGLQGAQAATALQPAGSPTPAPLAPVAAPAAPKVAPKSVAAPASGAVFYRQNPNDPNNQTLVNAQGQPVSYEQYLAQGGRPDWSNVLPGAFPGQPVATPAQTLSFGNGQAYDINGNPAPQPGALPVPTTPPATPPAADPNLTRIGELSKQLFSTATAPNQQKIYQEAFNASGLAEIKTRLTDLNTKIADLTAKYTAKEGDINENPFLSEASRVGRLKRLTAQRDAEIGNLVDAYKSYADLYNQGIEEINSAVERQVGDYNTQRQISNEELSYLLGIENAEAEQQATAEKNATAFAEKNNLTGRFYKYPGNKTVYDTRTMKPLSYEEYVALGGVGKPGMDSFPDVQTLQSELKTISEGQSLYDPVTGQIVNSVPKTYKPGSGTGTDIGGLSTAQFNRLNTISDNARQDANIKDFPSVRASYETARSAAGKSDGAGDIVLMRMIAKITDPTTGVREEEFRTFEGAQSTLARYGITLTKKMWAGDRLTDTGRAQLLQQATDIYNQRKSAYDSSVQFFTKQADGVAPGQGSSVIPYYVAPDGQSSGGSSVDLNDLF